MGKVTVKVELLLDVEVDAANTVKGRAYAAQSVKLVIDSAHFRRMLQTQGAIVTETLVAAPGEES